MLQPNLAELEGREQRGVLQRREWRRRNSGRHLERIWRNLIMLW